VNVLAVKIRLARAGAKKAPFYRIVVADSRAPRDGRFIEILGRYNPRTHPSTIEVDVEKADAWIAKGAVATETVAKLIAIAKDPNAVAPERATTLSKKAAAKRAAEEKAAEAAPAPAAEAEPSEAPSAEAEESQAPGAESGDEPADASDNEAADAQ
jgi:small subunit ribosomal protein S16